MDNMETIDEVMPDCETPLWVVPGGQTAAPPEGALPSFQESFGAVRKLERPQPWNSQQGEWSDGEVLERMKKTFEDYMPTRNRYVRGGLVPSQDTRSALPRQDLIILRPTDPQQGSHLGETERSRSNSERRADGSTTSEVLPAEAQRRTGCPMTANLGPQISSNVSIIATSADAVPPAGGVSGVQRENVFRATNRPPRSLGSKFLILNVVPVGPNAQGQEAFFPHCITRLTEAGVEEIIRIHPKETTTTFESMTRALLHLQKDDLPTPAPLPIGDEMIPFCAEVRMVSGWIKLCQMIAIARAVSCKVSFTHVVT